MSEIKRYKVSDIRDDFECDGKVFTLWKYERKNHGIFSDRIWSDLYFVEHASCLVHLDTFNNHDATSTEIEQAIRNHCLEFDH